MTCSWAVKLVYFLLGGVTLGTVVLLAVSALVSRRRCALCASAGRE